MIRFLAISVLIGLAGTAKADKLVLVAGGGTSRDDAPAAHAKLIAPFGIDFDKAGNLYLVELTGETVRKLDTKGIVSRVAGTGAKGNSGDNGPGPQAQLNGMHSLAIGAGGEIYLADTWNNRVRKLNPATGIISAFAGTGQKGTSGDGGPALKAEFGGIYCVALDAGRNNLYLADLDNRKIRKIDLKTGVVNTVAGNGKPGVPEDGAEAVSAPLVDPRAVAVDSKSNVYILERSGHALRVVDPSGKIHTVAGTGKAGVGIVEGDPLKSSFNGPKHLCIDHNDNVIIADTENHRILKYVPKEKKLLLLAGTGKKGSAGLDGPPTAAELNQPHGVQVDASGTLFIADSSNNRILKIQK